MDSKEIDIPNEIVDQLQDFHQSMKNMEEVLKPLKEININSTDLKLSPLEKARLNLTCGYALNSLFWMYLVTLGIDPKEHKIKEELERYKNFMGRVQEIADKDKAPVLNKEAAQRFVRNALWEPNNGGEHSSSSDDDQVHMKTESKR
ncbi:Nuclear nucleic acid-binding protein C1D, partial [Stegodyphus mimosarum]